MGGVKSKKKSAPMSQVTTGPMLVHESITTEHPLNISLVGDAAVGMTFMR
jgi:hypothetical protein